MTIDTIFPAADSTYLVTSHDARDPAAVARELIGTNLAAHPNNLVWAFYRIGPFGLIDVQDGVTFADSNGMNGMLSIGRTYRLHRLEGKSFFRSLTVPADEYLKGINEVYLQLCGVGDRVGPHAGGLTTAKRAKA